MCLVFHHQLQVSMENRLWVSSCCSSVEREGNSSVANPSPSLKNRTCLGSASQPRVSMSRYYNVKESHGKHHYFAAGDDLEQPVLEYISWSFRYPVLCGFRRRGANAEPLPGQHMDSSVQHQGDLQEQIRSLLGGWSAREPSAAQVSFHLHHSSLI